MPQAKQELRKVAQVQAGQRVRVQGVWYCVDEIKKAKKWADLNLSDSAGKLNQRLELNAEIMVEFNVPTVEERRMSANNVLLSRAQSAFETLNRARDKFISDFNSDPTYALEWADGLAEAGAAWKLWEHVLLITGNGDGCDLVESTEIVAKECVDDLLHFYGVNRSSSVFHNATRDKVYTAKAEFARSNTGWTRV